MLSLKVVLAVFGVTGMAVAVPLSVVLSRGGGALIKKFLTTKILPEP